MAVQDATPLSPVALDDATIEAFRTSQRGELLRPGDEGYDATRMLLNGMIDTHPALIVLVGTGRMSAGRTSSSRGSRGETAWLAVGSVRRDSGDTTPHFRSRDYRERPSAAL